MDFISLSLLNDDLFGQNQDGHRLSFRQATLAYPGSEAKNFYAAVMPETPTSVIQKPPSKQVTLASLHTVSSMVHIPSSSSVLAIQDYSSANDSSTSPSPLPSMGKEDEATHEQPFTAAVLQLHRLKG